MCCRYRLTRSFFVALIPFSVSTNSVEFSILTSQLYVWSAAVSPISIFGRTAVGVRVRDTLCHQRNHNSASGEGKDKDVSYTTYTTSHVSWCVLANCCQLNIHVDFLLPGWTNSWNVIAQKDVGRWSSVSGNQQVIDSRGPMTNAQKCNNISANDLK